jgi:hypothetical protein
MSLHIRVIPGRTLRDDFAVVEYGDAVGESSASSM